MSSGSRVSLIGHFNNIALHAIAMSLSMVDNALLLNTIGNSDSRIETINHPLPRSLNTRTNDVADSASSVGNEIIFVE